MRDECDLVFLALPHKESMSVVKNLSDSDIKIVDLSADYRLKKSDYEEYYCTHIDIKNLQNFTYGLPELFREDIKKTNFVANPGCYPTVSLLALAPFIEYIDETQPIFIDAKSGVSGAGKKPSSSSHFVSVNENMFVYNPITHRHSIEIISKLKEVSTKSFSINFIPTIIPATRGMSVNVYASLKKDINPNNILQQAYSDEKFIRIRNTPTDLKSVSGSNFCDIFGMKNDKALFVNASIDNLLRGASSQAIVNANIMYGLDENLGISNIAYAP
jgi:N-acetyl-gamma-glutamyl-phosphate reductase